MDEINKINLSEKAKFRLSEIIGTENYFYQETSQRKSYSKKLNKYVTALDYKDNVLTALIATSCGVPIISFTSIIGTPVGIASASFTLFFLTTGIVKKLLNITRNKKKKHDKILMLAKSKLNSIETLMSQALIDLDISHDEKDKHEKIKNNLISKNKKSYKIMRLSGTVKSKT